MAAGWALFNEGTMIVSALCIALGWVMIRRNKVRIHRRFMLAGTWLGALFFVSYAVGTLVVGDTEFGGPANYVTAYTIFLKIHVFLASIAALMGIWVLRLAFKRRFRIHRRVGPWTAVFWFITAATGLAVYLMLFVIFPPGPTLRNVLHVLGQ
ncbi:DUF420 domain-containing protein [Sulfoacidibacillus thermotolerans]|nr:DUF420 domain-containing protein [Sulfoacidibacillus thermotolerans]